MIGRSVGNTTYDAVVVGLGVMGAAALFHLARRGIRAIGIEADGPLHNRGSSHGDTRIFRRAYWEGEQYVPLLNRSHDGWLELNQMADHEVCHRTGGLFLGVPGSRLVEQSLLTAQNCGIRHEVLDAASVRARFPAFNVAEQSRAIYEPDALLLFATAARLALLQGAVEAGATLSFGSPVRSITSHAGRRGASAIGDGWSIDCANIVLTAGPWIRQFLGRELGPLLTPQRIPIYWFNAAPGSERQFEINRFPVFLLETGDGALVYGLPKWRDVRGGVKIGFHDRQLSDIDPDGARRPVDPAEIAELFDAIKSTFPSLQPGGRGTTCIYTMSPDGSFILGQSNENDSVCYASACSGHGFKFAPAIGEALAELVERGRTSIDIGMFAADRFAQARSLRCAGETGQELSRG